MAGKAINLEGNYNFPTPLYTESHFNRFRQTKFFISHKAAAKHARRWYRKLELDIKAHEALSYIFSFTHLKKGDTRMYWLSLADYLISFTTKISFVKATREYAFQANFTVTEHPESD